MMTDRATARAFLDMAPLVRRLEDWVAARGQRVRQQGVAGFDRRAFAKQTGFAPRGEGRPEVVLGRDQALELGHPRTASVSCVLLTARADLVEHGRVRWLGPDLPELAEGGSYPFGQLVVVRTSDAGRIDPFRLDSAQYLTHRLPGYMVRSVPGRLWIRLSRQARGRGFSLARVGQALVAAYRDDFAAVDAVEILFVTSDAAEVESLAPLAAEAQVMAGQHKKLVLGPDGEFECEDLDCEQCDEQPVCDSLRDVIIKRRRRRRRAAAEAS